MPHAGCEMPHRCVRRKCTSRRFSASSLNQEAAAQKIEAAVQKVLADGLRTADIYSAGTTKVTTREMGDAVVAALAAV